MEGGPQTNVQPGLQLNLQPLKEPRGFVRVLQFVFSIFAFSTTAGFWTTVRYVDKSCLEKNPGAETSFAANFDYPFMLVRQSVPLCGGSSMEPVGDFSTPAEYFVTTGVLTFLYCIAITAIYILYDQLYQNNALVPVIDFVATVIFAVFWLTASSVWAQGVSDLKYFADPNTFLMKEDACKIDTSKCYATSSGSFATLNVSLIFGFLNFALWAASLWFVYKETDWFKRRQNATG